VRPAEDLDAYQRLYNWLRKQREQVKIAEDFDAYQCLYYWFQLHFFLRSEPSERQHKVWNFLQELVYSTDDMHYRWEQKERGAPPIDAVRRIRRPPRGMRKAEAVAEMQKNEDAKPVKSFQGVWLPRVTSKKSVRCRFMLSDWLRTKTGSKWGNFRSLYRSLLIFDLHKAGNTADDIAAKFSGDLYLVTMSDHRSKLWIESILGNIAGGIEMELFRRQPPNESPDDRPLFLQNNDCDDDPNQEKRLSKIQIQQHYHRALTLIDLAKSGHFKSLSTLPPVKKIKIKLRNT